MGFDPIRQVQRIYWAKVKYFSKLLSLDTVGLGVDRVSDTSDLFGIYVWINSSVFTNLSYFLITTFALDPSEFEELGLTFNVGETTLSDLSQGIWASFTQYLSPLISTFLDFIKENIKSGLQEGFLQAMHAKGKYDFSRYDMSYYDPPVVREFLTSTLQGIFKTKSRPELYREAMKTVPETVEIHPTLAQYIYMKFYHVMRGAKHSFVLGQAILGFSSLGGSKVAIPTWEGTELDVPNERLEYQHSGFILGLAPLGFAYLQYPQGYYIDPQPPVTLFTNELANNTVNRYQLTMWAFRNYVRPDEMLDFRRCERADQYMALMFFRNAIENIVEGTLGPYGLSITELRMYKNAVNQLLALRTKRHRWGYEAFKKMDLEQLREWWIKYWVNKGLNESLLNRLWGVIGKWLPKWEKSKYSLQSYLARKRRRLANLGLKI